MFLHVSNANLQSVHPMHSCAGYQRELTYRHDDGSYSAFGKSDASGNTW